MDFLTRFGLEKTRMTSLVALGLLLLGSLSYWQMPKREDPAITIRTAIIEASLPGLSTERVERLIAEPLERAAREIGEIDDIETWIKEGHVEISVTVDASVPSTEIEQVFQRIRNKVADSAGLLPEGTQGPHVNTDFGDVAIATIAVTGAGFEQRELWTAAEALQRDLYALDGITKVSIMGRQEERIWLELDLRKLASVGGSVKQALADLKAQNIFTTAGDFTAGDQTIALQVNGEFTSVEEIAELLTQVPEREGFLRLQDLLSVKRGYVDPPEAPIFYNGQSALMMAVEMATDRDVQKIGRALKQALPRFEAKQPVGIRFEFSTFQENVVTKAINAALMNVAQTFAVVFVAIFLFLGIRPALVIASIVPFAVMFSLIVMRLWGVDLEQISIAAVIISLGLLVDNGLVVVEEIQKRLNLGVSAVAAAQQAGGQFLMPLAVASVTTVSAFVPMLILEGAEGEMAFSLGAVVGFMLLGSWFSAHYILPFFAVRLLKPRTAAPRSGGLVSLYAKLCHVSLRWGVGVLVLSYAFVALSMTLFDRVKVELFPLSERAEYLVYLDMPRGTAIEATMAEARAVEAWLNDRSINPEIVNTTVFVASGGPRFYTGLDPAKSDAASAFMVVNTEDAQSAALAAQRARHYLRSERPAARYRVTRLSMGEGEPGLVEYKLRGPDAEVLLAKAKEIEAAFARVPGIVTNENDWGNKVLRVHMAVSQDRARKYGLSSSDIAEVMNTYFSGSVQSFYREGADRIPIVLRAAGEFRQTLDDLKNISVLTDEGAIALDQLARIEPYLDYAQIRRENQTRQITVSGKSLTLTAGEVQSYMAPYIGAIDFPEGYELQLGGESETGDEVNALLLNGMAPALLLMLLALMIQFNSWRRVSLTFMTIPLVLVGAPLALYVTGRPLSFFAILGMISLAGIIINNAIVLIDQIDIERLEKPLDEAIVEAVKKRVTPVLLTSLTTVLGLLPMATIGGALFEPMATLMIGGLLLASPMTLFFVPALYWTMMKGRHNALVPERKIP